MNPITTANAEFCLDVFKELSSNNAGENIFFSPLTVFYALSMLLLGARGKSAEQMEKVLHYDNFSEFLNPKMKDFYECSQGGRKYSEFGALLSQINQLNSLSIANRIYGTRTITFHKGKSAVVDMMYQTGTFKLAFIKEPQMQVLELPYANNNLRMIILLPVGMANVNQIEKHLNVKMLQEWTNSSNMVEREVDVHIPKFNLAVKYDLNSLLKSLGMRDIFSVATADLSGMSPDKGLYLSKVVHKSYVDVNEEGTEAAAATGESIAVKRLPVTVQFTANSPFLFTIQDKSGNILFTGKLVSP
ncbi:serpin B11 isoform X2 [Microtus ochrogaster]|uniref:Serpin B11 isoform X2 n=1 Tax=Microtus ochrogaster TaxID=79684 RepID=A0ABM1AWT1_MICOH|nr:serpin B11 isoform X2 [Microtus ochrogaster]